MEKGSIESTPNKNKSTLVVYVVVSADFDRFERFYVRFVTRSQQLCSKSFLLSDIELSSLSLSCPLLQYFNRQASKRNNLANGRVANVSLGVVGLHVTYTKCPSLDIAVIIIIIIIFFSLATKIFLWRPFKN